MNQFISRLPIRTKLLFIIMVTTTLSLVLTGAIFIVYYSQMKSQDLDKDIRSIAKLIAGRSTAAITFQDPALAQENLLALRLNQTVLAAGIYSKSGKIIARYSSDTTIGRQLLGDQENFIRSDNSHLYIVEPITLDATTIGYVFICAGFRDVYIAQKNIMLFVTGIILLSLLFAFFLSSRLQHIVSKPILDLAHTARQISRFTDYSLRAARNSDDEIGTLVGAFNEMLVMIDSQNCDKKQLIDDLSQSKSMLFSILDTIPQSIYWKDENGIYMGCNRAFAQSVGLGDPDEIDGRMDSDFLWATELWESLRLKDESVLKTMTPVYHQLERRVNSNGAEVWFDSSVLPLTFTGEKKKIILGVMEDITEHKKAEEKILSANRVYAFISQINQMIVHTKSREEVFNAACQIAVEFGKFEMAWVGLLNEKTGVIEPFSIAGNESGYLSKFEITIHEHETSGQGPTGTATREGRYCLSNDIATDPQAEPCRQEALDRGYRAMIALPIRIGEKVIGSLSLYATVPNFFNADEIFLLDEVTSNIAFALEAIETEQRRKDAVNALSKEEEFLSAVFRTMEEGIIACDANGVLTRFNRATRELHGLPEQPLLPDEWAEYYNWFSADGKNRLKKDEIPLYRALQGELVHNVEMTVIPQQGKPKILSASGQSLKDQFGDTMGAVITLHDITERKYAEEQLLLYRDHLEELVRQRTAELELEKEHAESADRIKSAFLATMSHELRTPLNSIIGFTGIIMQERPGPLNIEQKKQLSMAQNSARHLLSLINDILDISKIEAGQLNVSFENFSLPEVIRKAVELNTPMATKKGLEINLRIAPRIGLMTSDKLRVQQILLNLINNAVKFTEKGFVSVDAEIEDNTILMKISDSGIGIKAEKIGELFKPFIQVDTGLARKHEGTGLGLSICKKLLELLGGEISVRSEFGIGSTFLVKLPIERNLV